MDKTIEKEFFKAFSGGVVSLCIEYVKCLHNLLDGNYLSSVEQIPPKEWNRIYNEELQIIKPISDKFDDTVIIGLESSLIDEIEGNLNLCTTKEQQDRYLYSLLIPFAELSNILHPENNIKRSSGNDAEIQLLHTTKEVFNDIIRVKEDRLLDGIERILRRFAIIMCQFGGRLDSLLLTYGIDLFRLQNECGVYLITDRCEWYLSNYIGSTELVQKYINELPSQTQPDSPAPQLPKELNEDQISTLYQYLIDNDWIEAIDKNNFSYIFGGDCVPSTNCITWSKSKTKQHLREMLKTIYTNYNPFSEIERVVEQVFIYKGEPMKLAKHKPTPSIDSDSLSSFLATLLNA